MAESPRAEGGVVWLTGLPASGKSTLAKGIAEWLRANDHAAVILDSDDLRQLLTPEPSYSEEERDWFYDVVAKLAALLADAGIVAVVAATANLRRYRDRARRLVERFVEIYVRADEVTRRERDEKGVYDVADENPDNQVPGEGATYEPPLAAEIIVDTSRLDQTEALDAVLGGLKTLTAFDDLWIREQGSLTK